MREAVFRKKLEVTDTREAIFRKKLGLIRWRIIEVCVSLGIV